MVPCVDPGSATQVENNYPLHEAKRSTTTVGKGMAVREECAKVLEEEQAVWTAVRGLSKGSAERITAEGRRHLRPGQTFMKELFCGSLVLMWIASQTFSCQRPSRTT